MPKARIKLYSTDLAKLNGVIEYILEIARKTNVEFSGPIHLPTKNLAIPVRRNPSGEGKSQWEHWEMRIHKRMVDLAADERALHLVMRVPIPQDVNIEIQVIE